MIPDPNETAADNGQDERAGWMRVLSRAPAEALENAWHSAGIDVATTDMRGPETGLVTVRGRIGGGGAPFNVGEATVTRLTVRLETGEVGHSYCLGRDAAKARIAATVDALWHRADARGKLRDQVIAPLAAAQDREDETARARAAATKVDFFTLVRGED